MSWSLEVRLPKAIIPNSKESSAAIWYHYFDEKSKWISPSWFRNKHQISMKNKTDIICSDYIVINIKKIKLKWKSLLALGDSTVGSVHLFAVAQLARQSRSHQHNGRSVMDPPSAAQVLFGAVFISKRKENGMSFSSSKLWNFYFSASSIPFPF